MPITYLDEESAGQAPAEDKPKITYLDDPKVHYSGEERASTGEDVFNLVAANPNYIKELNRDEYVALRNYKEQHPVSFFTKAKEAGSGILSVGMHALEDLAKMNSHQLPDNPAYWDQNPSEARVALAPAEVAGRGIAMGVSSLGQMGYKAIENTGNWLNGLTDDNLNSYQRYLANNKLKDTPESKQAYEANVDKSLASFKELAAGDQNIAGLAENSPYRHITEAISYVAQPEVGFGAALEAIGAGAKIGSATARVSEAIGGGVEKLGKGLVYAAERPQEWAGAAAKAITDSDSIARRATSKVGNSYLASTAKLAAKSVETGGEITRKVSENLAKGESRIGAFEALGRDLTASAAARTAGTIGAALGADALTPYIGAVSRGAAEGAAIGAALGYISDGEDGAASGLGSGLVFGAGGALAGRAFRDVTGETRRSQVINDSIRSLDGMTPESVVNGARLMDNLIRDGNANAAAELADTRNFLKGDVDWHYVTDDQAKQVANGVTFEGVTVKTDGQRPAVYINVDRVKPGTAFHEGLHGALRTALGTKYGPMISEAVKTYFTPEEIAKFKQDYVNRAGNNAIMRQELEAKVADTNYVHEEMGAEFFRNFLQRPENVDMLLRGKRTGTGSLMSATLDAIDSSLRSLGYRDEVKPRNNAMRKTVEELISARTKLNKEIAKGGKPAVEVPLAKMPSAHLETWAQQHGQSDVLIKDAQGNVVGVKTEDQVQTSRDNAYQSAANDLASVPRGNGVLTDAELAIYHKYLPPDHFAKLVFINDAIKRGLTVGADYFPATKKSDETSVYATRGMTTREVVPYEVRIGSKGQVLVNYLDVSQLRARFDDMMSRKGVSDLWGGDRAKAWADVLEYSKNLAKGDKARPSAELFGATKRDVLNKTFGFVPTREQLKNGLANVSSLGVNTRRESGTGPERVGKPLFEDSADTRTVSSFRLDRLGSLTDRGASFAFNKEGSYNLSQVNFKPAQNIGNGRVFDSEDGYRIIEKNGRFSLYGRDGKRLGIYGSPEEANRKASGLKSKQERQSAPSITEPDHTVEAGTLAPEGKLSDIPVSGAPIDWKSSEMHYQPAVLPEVYKPMTPEMRDQLESVSPTIAAIHIDRMRVGAYKGIDLQGGMFYPTIVENLKNRVVWAFNGENVARSVAKRAAANGGFVKLVLMQEGNVIGNKTFSKIWFNDLRENIAAGKISERRALQELNSIRHRWARDPQNATGHTNSWKTLADAEQAITGMPQQNRGSTYFQKTRTTTKSEGEKIAYQSLLSQKMTEMGFPDAVQIVRDIEEPAFKGVPQGATVGLLRFDPVADGAKIKTAQEAGVPEHYSYKYVLHGEPVAKIQHYKVLDRQFPEVKNKILSQQHTDFPIREAIPAGAHEAHGSINFMPAAEVGMKLKDVGPDFVEDQVAPTLLDTSKLNQELGKLIIGTVNSFPASVSAADGSRIDLSGEAYRGGRNELAMHMAMNNSAHRFDPSKTQWIGMVPETLKNAAVRLVDDKNGSAIYVRQYKGGTKHMVVVAPNGTIISQKPFTGSLITQFPKGSVRQDHMTIDWVRREDATGLYQGTPGATPAGSFRPGNPRQAFQGQATDSRSEVNPSSSKSPRPNQDQNFMPADSKKVVLDPQENARLIEKEKLAEGGGNALVNRRDMGVIRAEDGTPVGTYGFADNLGLSHIYIKPEYRRQGYGEAAVREIAKYGVKFFMPNEQSLPLLEKVGKSGWFRYDRVTGKGVVGSMPREQIRFMPAEQLPHGTIQRTQDNYSVLKKNGGKFRVYSPAGLLIGVAESLDKAQRIIAKHQ